MRALLRQWNGDPFVHAPRDGAARAPAVSVTGFAAWTPRIVLWCAARMWGGLTSAGSQRGFQFPAQPLRLLFQPLDLFLEPFTLLPQPLVLLLRTIQLPLRNKLDARALLVCRLPADWFHPTLPVFVYRVGA